MPQALQLPLLCLATTESSGGDYAACVREAIRLGGCSASRAIFVGAVSAALGCDGGEDGPTDGEGGVPAAWVAKLAEPERMRSLATELAMHCEEA